MKTFARYALPILIVMGLLLTACAPAATEAPAEQPVAEQPVAEQPVAEQPVDPACGPVQLQYWNPFTGPDGPFMGEMVYAFNASHPDIQVTMTSQGEYYTQLATAAAADTLPDVAIVHADQVALARKKLADFVARRAGRDFQREADAVRLDGQKWGQRMGLTVSVHFAAVWLYWAPQ